MKLRTDPDFFLAQQDVFTGGMIARIADRLEGAGIKGQQLKELTGKIAFDIACMLDDTAGIEFDGVEAHLYLAFTAGSDEIIHLGGNSTAHEMVYGILNAMIEGN